MFIFIYVYFFLADLLDEVIRQGGKDYVLSVRVYRLIKDMTQTSVTVACTIRQIHQYAQHLSAE